MDSLWLVALSSGTTLSWSLNVVPLEEEGAYLTGLLRPTTRSAGLSFGDRACVGLALQLGLPVLTVDQQWVGLDLGLEVRLAR